MQRILILGVGNTLRADDGLGVFAVRALTRETWPPAVRLLDGGTSASDLAPELCGLHRLVVLDAVRAGAAPGTLHRLDETRIRQENAPALSVHDLSILDTLGDVRAAWGEAPALTVLGLEPMDITSWRIGLSTALAPRFAAYLEAVRREVVSPV